MNDTFSLGVINRSNLNNNKKCKGNKKKKSNGILVHYKLPKQIFTFAPTSYYSSPFVAHLCSFLPIGRMKQEEWCQAWERSPYPKPRHGMPSATFGEPSATFGEPSATFGQTEEEVEQLPCFQDLSETFWSPSWGNLIRNELPRLYKLRWTFRRFLHKWRCSYLQKVNTEDIVTCEPPIHLITITDWTQRQMYVFEASTLMRDITNRLSHHDGFFEQPQAPRNPLTNLPLTPSQIISIWNQLNNAPIPKSNVFTAFKKSRMNLNSFRYEHKLSLQLHALRTSMAEFTHYDASERLLDFIDIAFDRQGAICDYDIWEYMVNHRSDHEVIQKWKALCLKFYEIDLRYESHPQQKEVQQNKIWTLTFPLLHKQQELLPLLPTDILEQAEENVIQAIHALHSITMATVIIPDIN